MCCLPCVCFEVSENKIEMLLLVAKSAKSQPVEISPHNHTYIVHDMLDSQHTSFWFEEAVTLNPTPYTLNRERRAKCGPLSSLLQCA